MSMSKIASLFGAAGALGLIVAVLIGPTERTGYLIEASFVCLALGGLFVVLYVLVNLWADFTRSGDLQRRQQ